MSSFLIEFERRYTKLKSHCLWLPEEIQGCKLLEVADLQQSQKQMLLSAVTSLKYSDVKRVLRRMFVGIGDSAEGEIRVSKKRFLLVSTVAESGISAETIARVTRKSKVVVWRNEPIHATNRDTSHVV